MMKVAWPKTTRKHPAKYSEPILEAAAKLLDPSHVRILDPFAGVGRIHHFGLFVPWEVETIGIEIEEGWALEHPKTICGNALDVVQIFGACDLGGAVDAIVTSPTYGNRMADSHNAKDGSYRRSYTHDLGAKLAVGNTGGMQWGRNYQSAHTGIWMALRHVLRPGGRLVLNISDHIRGGKRQYVSAWHVRILTEIGFRLADCTRVVTKRHKRGSNAEARVGSELVMAFDLVAGDMWSYPDKAWGRKAWQRPADGELERYHHTVGTEWAERRYDDI